MNRGDQIVKVAQSYLGLREIPNNLGWDNKTFEAKMKQVGWIRSQAWCAYFGELVWKEAYADQPEILKELDRLFSASATTTYANFDKESKNPNSKLKIKVSKTPVNGAIVIYRFGTGWQGHLGVVEFTGATKVDNIEGNTGVQGLRDGDPSGDGVARKKRLITPKVTARGLNLVGYIHPISLK
jgi:hypothetical protein